VKTSSQIIFSSGVSIKNSFYCYNIWCWSTKSEFWSSY